MIIFRKLTIFLLLSGLAYLLGPPAVMAGAKEFNALPVKGMGFLSRCGVKSGQRSDRTASSVLVRAAQPQVAQQVAPVAGGDGLFGGLLHGGGRVVGAGGHR